MCTGWLRVCASGSVMPLLASDAYHRGHWKGRAKRGWAKLFHRPDPGHFDTAKLLPVAYAVMGFLIISGGALIVADIVSPMQLF